MIYIKRLFSFLGLIIVLIISIILSLISVLTYPIQIMYFYVRYGDEAEIPECFEIGEKIYNWYIDHLMAK
jgi:hypothetical protein